MAMVKQDFRGLVPRMISNASARQLSIEYWIQAWLYFYAVAYPLIANFSLADKEAGSGEGSPLLQVFQFSVQVCLIVYFLLNYYIKHTWKSTYWLKLLMFFGCILFLMFRVNRNFASLSEWSYFSRIGMWILWFVVLSQINFQIPHYRIFIIRLTRCFWWGGLTQCLLAWYYWFIGGKEIYSRLDITAATGNASGKLVVSFVVMFLLLSFYWSHFRNKWFYSSCVLLGISCVFISYNRASQLALGAAVLYYLIWLIRHQHLKQFVSLVTAILLFAALLVASGRLDALMTRWKTVEEDEGSGRLTLHAAAIHGFLHPDTQIQWVFGRGVVRAGLYMERMTGFPFSCHSDLFDMMNILGMCGVAFYLLVQIGMMKTVTALQSGSSERAVAACCVVFLLVTGLATGVFQNVYTQCFYATLAMYWLTAEVRKEKVPLPKTGKKRRKRKLIVHWDNQQLGRNND